METCNHYCPGCAAGDCPLKDEIKALKEEKAFMEDVIEAYRVFAIEHVPGSVTVKMPQADIDSFLRAFNTTDFSGVIALPAEVSDFCNADLTSDGDGVVGE